MHPLGSGCSEPNHARAAFWHCASLEPRWHNHPHCPSSSHAHTHTPHSLAAAAGVGAVTPFSSSIVLAVPTDYLMDGSGRSKCIEMVER